MSYALMIQGTGSDVGKSLLVAGIARALVNRGLSVAPFKPQNMSNNAAVTVEGGEVGRAQALQARAARVPLSNHMNPILLKPQSDIGAQVVVQGHMVKSADAREYQEIKRTLLPHSLDSFNRLKNKYDFVIIEGAGSPAEVNLRKNDIANMGFAEAADIPVILAGDIDRGGVIAQIVGTHALLSASEKKRVQGYIVNKFRGDLTLFDDGLKITTAKTGWQSMGVVPFFNAAKKLPPEDAFSIEPSTRALKDVHNWNSEEKSPTIHIAVPIFSRIANFDDFDPLRSEPGVKLIMVSAGEPIPGNSDLVILPGSKSTIADMRFLKDQGWDIDIKAHLRRGGKLLGICGGYQMLGKVIRDPDGIEGSTRKIEGLGLLDFETTMSGNKKLLQENGTHIPSQCVVNGYHMHLGECRGEALKHPFLRLQSGPDGCQSADGSIMGTYLHGLFANDEFRLSFLNELKPHTRRVRHFETEIENTLDQLSQHLEKHLDIDRMLEIAQC
ncbi:cobyric acid synthase [Sneathiella glossodoripedis]|uniref:cobyric acid synthase n=1 Tax=Sneathiella glossodoripedis TaxID=418853 RepID=UPI00046EA416|nr:cobyric acid synthase [Sneathiella glossodoripedis]